jgi:hypothetical protein
MWRRWLADRWAIRHWRLFTLLRQTRRIADRRLFPDTRRSIRFTCRHADR